MSESNLQVLYQYAQDLVEIGVIKDQEDFLKFFESNAEGGRELDIAQQIVNDYCTKKDDDEDEVVDLSDKERNHVEILCRLFPKYEYNQICQLYKTLCENAYENKFKVILKILSMHTKMLSTLPKSSNTEKTKVNTNAKLKFRYRLERINQEYMSGEKALCSARDIPSTSTSSSSHSNLDNLNCRGPMSPRKFLRKVKDRSAKHHSTKHHSVQHRSAQNQSAQNNSVQNQSTQHHSAQNNLVQHHSTHNLSTQYQSPQNQSGQRQPSPHNQPNTPQVIPPKAYIMPSTIASTSCTAPAHQIPDPQRITCRPVEWLMPNSTSVGNCPIRLSNPRANYATNDLTHPSYTPNQTLANRVVDAVNQLSPKPISNQFVKICGVYRTDSRLSPHLQQQQTSHVLQQPHQQISQQIHQRIQQIEERQRDALLREQFRLAEQRVREIEQLEERDRLRQEFQQQPHQLQEEFQQPQQQQQSLQQPRPPYRTYDEFKRHFLSDDGPLFGEDAAERRIPEKINARINEMNLFNPYPNTVGDVWTPLPAFPEANLIDGASGCANMPKLRKPTEKTKTTLNETVETEPPRQNKKQKIEPQIIYVDEDYYNVSSESESESESDDKFKVHVRCNHSPRKVLRKNRPGSKSHKCQCMKRRTESDLDTDDYTNVPSSTPKPRKSEKINNESKAGPSYCMKLSSHIMEMFPDACPTYIKSLCIGKTMSEKHVDELLQLIFNTPDYPKRGEKSPTPPLDMNLETQTQLLKDIFPNADPTYLESEAQNNLGDPKALEAFITRTLERHDYPTKKDYLRRQQLNAQVRQYTTEFDVDNFLKIIPDPEAYFGDLKRCTLSKNDPVERHLCVQVLKNMYPLVGVRHLSQFVHNDNLMIASNTLDTKVTKQMIIKSKRKQMHVDLSALQNIPLLQEICYLTNREVILRRVEEKKEQEAKEREEAKANGLMMTCNCCFDEEVMPKDCATCENGCNFCKTCVRSSVQILFNEGKADFPCLVDCSAVFGLTTLMDALEPRLFSKVAQRKQLQEVKAAGIDDVVSCPFCDFATIPAPGDKIFKCLNPDCMKESCRECKEPSHVPLRCDEIEKDDDVKKRTYIENKMTEALVRVCYKCGMKFIKEDGCNKMTCSCGAMMCYICSKPVTDYKHFNGQGGDKYHLCPLYSDINTMHERQVLEGAAMAKQELGIEKDEELKVDPIKDVQEHYETRRRSNRNPVLPGLVRLNQQFEQVEPIQMVVNILQRIDDQREIVRINEELGRRRRRVNDN